MFVRKGMSAVRVDLTNVVVEMEKKGDIVVVLDRGRPVAGLVPVALVEAIEHAVLTQSEETDPLEFVIATLRSGAKQNAPQQAAPGLSR